jgi:hypothetical protein
MSVAIASERHLAVPQGAFVRLAWTERERGMPDALILRLGLDNEVQEYTLDLAPEVALELIEFFQRGTHAWLNPELAESRLRLEAGSQAPGTTPPRWAEASFMRT